MIMKNHRKRQTIRPSNVWTWVAGAGAILILYLMISTTKLLYSSTNMWYGKGRQDQQTNIKKGEKQNSEYTTLQERINLTKIEQTLSILIPSNIPDDVEVKTIAQLYPNIPILYWMEVRNKLRKMHLTNESCAPFPDIYNLNIHNTYWQTVDMSNSTSIQIYSAYYDKREVSGKVVRILSMVNKTNINFPGNQTTYCQLWFDGEKEPVVVPVNIHEYMWFEYWHLHEDGMYGPFLLGCSIPQSHIDKIPQVVSLVDKPCDRANNMLRVVYEEPTNRKEFAVCVKGLDFQMSDLSFRLVEWIEFMFLMGVDKIFFYRFDVHPKMRKVLDYYQKLGKVDIRDITLPRGNPSIPLLEHIFLLNNNVIQCLDEIIPYNDCFYRNLYSYDYVALLDIDEIILPLKDNNWHDLIERVRSDDYNVKYNAFIVQHIYFLDKMQKEGPYEDIPSYMHMLQHVYRAQKFITWNHYSKTIYSTNETVACHNHWPIIVANGSVTHSFSHDDARMQHYRKDCAWDVNCTEYDTDPIKDIKMWDFKDSLIANVIEVVDKIGLLDKHQ